MKYIKRVDVLKINPGALDLSPRRGWIRVWVFNSSLQELHTLCDIPIKLIHGATFSTGKQHEGMRALETSLGWNSQDVLVLNLVFIVRAKGRQLPCELWECKTRVNPLTPGLFPKKFHLKLHILQLCFWLLSKQNAAILPKIIFTCDLNTKLSFHCRT